MCYWSVVLASERDSSGRLLSMTTFPKGMVTGDEFWIISQATKSGHPRVIYIGDADPGGGSLATDSYNLNSPAATEGPLPKASASQPPIRHRPPRGVTGPRNLNRVGSRTRA